MQESYGLPQQCRALSAPVKGSSSPQLCPMPCGAAARGGQGGSPTVPTARTSPGTWPSSISTKVQEAAPEQDPGSGTTLLFSARQSRTHLPSVWNLPSVRAQASHSGTSSVPKSTSHQRKPGFKSTEGTDTARDWKSFFHPTGTQPHTYSALCHQLQKCQQRVSKSLQLSHEYCSLQRGHFFPPPDFEWKDVSAVKNQVQQYLLWSFLSAALISNTRSRSHFCWTSLSIFFRKSTFAVPLRSCSTEKGGEVWLNRVRNDRTVTDHRAFLISSGKGKHCSSDPSQQSRWLCQPVSWHPPFWNRAQDL